MRQLSKTKFKAHALEVLRDVEQSGKSIFITDRGMPTLEIRKLRQQELQPLELLRGTVVKYYAPLAPVADNDWENV